MLELIHSIDLEFLVEVWVQNSLSVTYQMLVGYNSLFKVHHWVNNPTTPSKEANDWLETVPDPCEAKMIGLKLSRIPREAKNFPKVTRIQGQPHPLPTTEITVSCKGLLKSSYFID